MQKFNKIILERAGIRESTEFNLEQYVKNKYSEQIVNIAQNIYNDWIGSKNEDYFQDEYAGGGICHLIANVCGNKIRSNMIFSLIREKLFRWRRANWFCV